MAFITPDPVDPGDVLSASKYNQDVVENVRFYLPTGALVPFVGAAAPTEFLLCDGAAVSRTTYADLFAVCSTTYGAGDGSTTFNLPDLRGRIPIGAGTGAQNGGSGTGAITGGTTLTARSRGAFAGDERLATHNHAITDPGHAHNYGVIGNGQAGGGVVTPTNSLTFTQVTASNTTGISVNNAGTGSGANMPPFIVTNYLIKT